MPKKNTKIVLTLTVNEFVASNLRKLTKIRQVSTTVPEKLAVAGESGEEIPKVKETTREVVYVRNFGFADLNVVSKPEGALYTTNDACFTLFKLILNVSCIVMGCVYLDDCTVERMIPIFVLVSGVVGWVAMSCSESNRVLHAQGLLTVYCLVQFFVLAWMIFGSVLVFKHFQPSFNATMPNENYCAPEIYWFAFSYLVYFYVTSSIIILCGCFLCCLICCLTVSNAEQRAARDANLRASPNVD